MTAPKPKPEFHPTKKRPTQNARAARRFAQLLDTCAHCGLVRERKSAVVEVAGEMREIGARQKQGNTRRRYKVDFTPQLPGTHWRVVNNPGSAYYRYKAEFGVVPSIAPGPKRLAR